MERTWRHTHTTNTRLSLTLMPHGSLIRRTHHIQTVPITDNGYFYAAYKRAALYQLTTATLLDAAADKLSPLASPERPALASLPKSRAMSLVQSNKCPPTSPTPAKHASSALHLRSLMGNLIHTAKPYKCRSKHAHTHTHTYNYTHTMMHQKLEC